MSRPLSNKEFLISKHLCRYLEGDKKRERDKEQIEIKKEIERKRKKEKGRDKEI